MKKYTVIIFSSFLLQSVSAQENKTEPFSLEITSEVVNALFHNYDSLNLLADVKKWEITYSSENESDLKKFSSAVITKEITASEIKFFEGRFVLELFTRRSQTPESLFELISGMNKRAYEFNVESAIGFGVTFTEE